MSSLSVCLSADQCMVGGREGGEREVEVSLFEVLYCIVLYYIISPSLFPSFPFILLSTTTLGNFQQQQPFSTTLPDLSACFQDHA